MARLARSILEVERKFKPDSNWTSRFEANSGSPAFRSIHFIGTSQFEDVYYDRSRTLISQNVWLRRRDSAWQAKVRQGGNFRNSAFEEITQIQDIKALVKKLFPSSNMNLDTFGLSEMARFTSYRSTWKVNNRFTVVLDATDFGHSVGEVELEVQDSDHSQLHGPEPAGALDKEIEDFMHHYSWAFPEGDPVGKLSAYLTINQKQWD